MNLTTKTGKVAHLHVTWTEWKNLFSFEVTGERGKLHIDGLGGSYGVERLAYYQMTPEMGPPITKIWEWPGADNSWKNEWNHFLQEIEDCQVSCSPGLRSTQEVLSIISKVYQLNG